MKKILYVGYYDDEINKEENRGYALSARNKMKYIATAIMNNGHQVEIVSLSQTSNMNSCKGKKYKVNDNLNIKLFYSLGRKGVLSRIVRKYIMIIQLYLYLLINTNEKSDVIVYHSLSYMRSIKILKRIKKFNLILEVEEVYGDVTNDTNIINKEYNFFELADSYIFPTELLNQKINNKGKKFVVVYGSYEVERIRDSNFLDFSTSDNTIHVLYAGTLDPRKGGAEAAVRTAEHLSSNYHVHILGFGTKKDIERIKRVISQVKHKCQATVTYDGVLSGEKYISFVQQCQIGLSTQNPNADFNDTSFPSKVLSYLSNGIRVVSIRINVLEKSEISDLLYYYDKQKPEIIAEAIKSVDLNGLYDSRTIIKKLDLKFVKNIGDLLK